MCLRPKVFEGKVCVAFALNCCSGDGRIIVVEVFIHNSVKIKLRGTS